jgi:ankyrin repeat protein
MSGTSQLLEELSEFCRSDSLSEDGLRGIIERHGIIALNNNITDYKFFHDACRNERLTDGILRYLLQYFPNAARAVGEEGRLPLQIACFNKNVTLNMVHLLIDAFPDSVRHENNKGSMPLHALCGNKHLNEEVVLEILKLLVEKCPESVRQTSRDSNLPIHPAAAFQSPGFCRLLIEAYPGSERITNIYGYLPFHAACQCNTVATAKYLYQLYPESINVAAKGGTYPIHCAIRGLTLRSNPKDGIEVVKFLLECNPDALISTGETPLHIACRIENVTLEIVQLLVDAFPESLCHEENKGYIPLHLLCLNKNLDEEVRWDILKLLMGRCLEPVRHAATESNLPIHIAAANQSPEFCRLLIEAYSESERKTNDNGQLPFHYACRCNTVATAKYLYQLYPESISVANNRGRYPIHWAIAGLKRRSNPKDGIEVMRFLLDCNPDVVLQKHQGKLPLYWVCKETQSDNTSKLIAYLQVLQILYDAYPEAIESNEVTSNVGEFCAEVQTFINTQLTYARQARDHHLMHSPDEDGQIPLHKALRGNACLGSIKLLVKGNPLAVRCPDNTGMIPLHVACQHHASISVIEYLIDLYSFALETKDRSQNTLLHFACRGANHAIITLLLERPAASFVSTRNSQRQLPIDLLFESEAVSDRNDIKYVESIYRLIRAYPETLMSSNSATSNNEKKRKFSDM